MVPKWFNAVRLEWEHRRRRQRINRYFSCTWQSAFGPTKSRISSLSPTGCYIEDRLLVAKPDEEIPELTIDLSPRPVTVQGLVLDSMPGIGFAVRFMSVDRTTRDYLSAVVQQYATIP